MRTALFSDKERDMIKHYLKTGEKGDQDKDFNVLAYRCRSYYAKIKEDFNLISRFLEKTSSD